MRKLINGKIYDTETAESLHFWNNGFYAGDFKYRSKELYKTKKGAYFIHHVGGPSTDMAVQAGSNSYSGSESIEPIDESEVLRFLEDHDGTETILEHFPETVEEA